jgi:hypothetical protein
MNPLTMTTPSSTDNKSEAVDPFHALLLHEQPAFAPNSDAKQNSYRYTFSLTDSPSFYYRPMNIRLGPLKSLIIPQPHLP